MFSCSLPNSLNTEPNVMQDAREEANSIRNRENARTYFARFRVLWAICTKIRLGLYIICSLRNNLGIKVWLSKLLQIKMSL